MDESSLQEMWDSPSFLLSLGDAGDLKPVHHGAQQTPDLSRRLASLSPALLSHSPELLWLKTRKTGLGNLTGKTRGTNCSRPALQRCPGCSCKGGEREDLEPSSPKPQTCTHGCPARLSSAAAPGREPGEVLGT